MGAINTPPWRRCPTGVLSMSTDRAEKIISDLGLWDAYPLDRRAVYCEGARLHSVIVDGGIHMADDLRAVLTGNLLITPGPGTMYQITEVLL